MNPLEFDNTLRAHRTLQAALYFPSVMESIRHREPVSHRQQERATAQNQIAALRARKVGTLTAAQELFSRMKDRLDARTFHHVLQGVMDLQQNRRSTSDVVEQLRLLIAHHHPKLFEDFLDYIDPTNEVERQETTKEPTKTEDIRSLPKFGSKALSDHSASAYAGLLSRTFVHPGQPASPLRHVANFAQYPVKAKSPSPDRRIGNESSPGMYGFPEPPLVYSPVPPTFAQSFYDYVNQEQFTPRYPVETAMPTHGLPMPPIAAVSPRDVQQVVRLPSIGRFGPGVNPFSPRVQAAAVPPTLSNAPPKQQQQPLRPPKTRSILPKPAVSNGVGSHPQPLRPQPSPLYQGDVTFLSPEKLGPYDYISFPTYQQDVYFNLPNASTIQIPRQVPLQRKRGMSDLRSNASQPPRKVSKTESGSRPSSNLTSSSQSGRVDTPTDDEAEKKPFVHHICGRRFTTLESVKGHHHNEEKGLGCWVRCGSKEKDKAWDAHPSCKVETITSTGLPEASPDPLRSSTESSTSRPTCTSKKSRRKSDESFRATSSSGDSGAKDDGEYFPGLGMPKSEVDAIKYGPRPKRGIKESGTKSIVAMKWNETFEDALD